MASADEVEADVSRAVEQADFVQRLAERIGLDARASAVFGDPVEREGITVVPVAKATWGFGGGGGGDGASQGSGGGGGAVVSPLGFIEIRPGGAKFVRIRDLRATALGLATAGAIIGAAFARRRARPSRRSRKQRIRR